MIVFKKAVIDDCKMLSILKQQAWESTYAGIYDDDLIINYDYKVNEEKFASHIRDEHANLYVVYYEQKPVGYFNYGTQMKEYKNFKFYLRQLYLISSAQGKGIGRQILSFIREALKKENVTKFFCNCNYYNKSAIAFYQKMGGIVTDCVLDGKNKIDHQVYIEFEV